MRVKTQECLQEVLLRPEPKVVKHGVARIIEGQKDVMDVDQNPGPKARQDLKIFAQHVTASGYHVAGVDEENVIALNCVEQFYRHILHGGRNPLDAAGPWIGCKAL